MISSLSPTFLSPSSTIPSHPTHSHSPSLPLSDHAHILLFSVSIPRWFSVIPSAQPTRSCCSFIHLLTPPFLSLFSIFGSHSLCACLTHTQTYSAFLILSPLLTVIPFSLLSLSLSLSLLLLCHLSTSTHLPQFIFLCLSLSLSSLLFLSVFFLSFPISCYLLHSVCLTSSHYLSHLPCLLSFSLLLDL